MSSPGKKFGKGRRNGRYLSEIKSIGAGINKRTQRKGPSFFKDFSVGCGALILLALLIFVLVPLIIIGFKIALWLAALLVGLIIIIVLVALFGRFISETRKRW